MYIQLPRILLVEPTICLDFVIPGRMNEQLLLQLITKLIRIYKSVWHSIRTSRARLGQPASTEFFTLHNVVQSDTGRVVACPYLVTFAISPSRDQFRVLVLRSAIGDEAPTVILEENHPRPLPPPQQQQAQPVNVNANANARRMDVVIDVEGSGDESDGSSLTELSSDEEE